MHEDRSNEDLSLEQIENDVWQEGIAGTTRLMATVHELRSVPLRELQAEDLRMLISQNVGLDVLVPRAISLLNRDPLIEGDLYPGDLLVAVLNVSPLYWRANVDQHKAIKQIVETLRESEHELSGDIALFLARGE